MMNQAPSLPPQWMGNSQPQFRFHEQPWWTHPIVLLFGGALVYAVFSEAENGASERACGVCGRPGHDRRTCPHGAKRVHFSTAVRKSRYCECCGQDRYATHRHHTRGRANVSDYLDVCLDCHLDCCHDGDFQNLARKPQVCRVLDRPSAWLR